MNGNFEQNRSTYPIGYLRAGDAKNAAGESLYRVSDMRSLEPLHSQPIPLSVAASVANGVNVQVRAKRVLSKGGIEAECAYQIALATE